MQKVWDLILKLDPITDCFSVKKRLHSWIFREQNPIKDEVLEFTFFLDSLPKNVDVELVPRFIFEFQFLGHFIE